MRQRRFFLVLVVLLAVAGCCHMQAQFVAIPEAVSRSEVQPSERIALPLTPQSRDLLLRFLRAGGNRTRMASNTLVDPAAAQHYGGLLDLLGQPENLTVANLTQGSAFRPWFPSGPIRQVIDARNEAPPAVQPFALLDLQGEYWWIFDHSHGQLTRLMVIKAMRPKPEE